MGIKNTKNANISYIRFAEQTGTLDTPATGYWYLAFKDDGIYLVEDTGTSVRVDVNDATFILQTTYTDLPNAQALSALSDGLLKHASGVVAQAVANTDYVALTGSATLTDKTLTTPTIGDFTNAAHDHEDAAGGATLDAAAIGAGTLDNARVNWAAPGTLGSTTPSTVSTTAVTRDVRTETGTAAVQSSDHIILCDATSANVIVQLPTSSGITGRVLTFVRTDSPGSYTCTIQTNSTETINGVDDPTLTAQYETMTIVSDGTNWYEI